jgi:hypothetical protein
LAGLGLKAVLEGVQAGYEAVVFEGRFVGQQDFDGQPPGGGVTVLAKVAEADLN